MLDSSAYDSKSGNPFSDRPPTSRRNEEAQRALDAAVAELDSNAPENFDDSVWERLCNYRRAKIEMEVNVSSVWFSSNACFNARFSEVVLEEVDFQSAAKLSFGDGERGEVFRKERKCFGVMLLFVVCLQWFDADGWVIGSWFGFSSRIGGDWRKRSSGQWNYRPTEVHLENGH